MIKYKELRNLSGGHETYSKTAYFRNCIGRNKGQQQGMTVCMHRKDFQKAWKTVAQENFRETQKTLNEKNLNENLHTANGDMPNCVSLLL